MTVVYDKPPGQTPVEGITKYSDASSAEATYANQKQMQIWFYHITSYVEAYEQMLTTQFKGFLTNYTDSYTLNWKMHHCYGRNDPIQTYGSTTRTVNFSWDIVANDEQEAISNLKKCTTLFKMLYPVYENRGNALSITGPPLMGIRFSNLIQQQNGAPLTGVVSGFDFSPELNAGFFDTKSGVDSLLLPKVLNLKCTLSVTHRHPIGWDRDTGHQITNKQEIKEYYHPGQNSMEYFPYAVGFTPRAGEGMSLAPVIDRPAEIILGEPGGEGSVPGPAPIQPEPAITPGSDDTGPGLDDQPAGDPGDDRRGGLFT